MVQGAAEVPVRRSIVKNGVFMYGIDDGCAEYRCAAGVPGARTQVAKRTGSNQGHACRTCGGTVQLDDLP